MNRVDQSENEGSREKDGSGYASASPANSRGAMDAEPAAAAASGQPGREKLTGRAARKAMRWTRDRIAQLGGATSALMGRLKKDRSPENMIATLDDGLAKITPVRERSGARLEELYGEIAEGKRGLAGASPARRRVLEHELRSRLAEYRALEHQYTILLENERQINAVRGKLMEMVAYGMAAVDEQLIDAVADDVEDAAVDAEARDDSVRDLQRAGRRRERQSDHDDLMEALDEFEGEGQSGRDTEDAVQSEENAGDRRAAPEESERTDSHGGSEKEPGNGREPA